MSESRGRHADLKLPVRGQSSVESIHGGGTGRLDKPRESQPESGHAVHESDRPAPPRDVRPPSPTTHGAIQVGGSYWLWLAVVTGASSGIGRELARQAAGHGYDVVLVARREQRLQALAEELQASGVAARPVAADLSEPSGVQRVLAAVAGAPVDVLINDAGVGGRGAFAVERNLAADLAMIRLNVIALVELTGVLLPGMIERGQGGVLNVASIAGYLSGPGQAVYNASKAFVKSFSQAVAEETPRQRRPGERLVPGPGAHRVRPDGRVPAEVRGNPLMPVRSGAEVAAAGWDGLMAGRAVIVPDLPTRIGLQALRLLPWRLIARTAASPPRRPTGTGDER